MVEYRDITNSFVLASLDSGAVSSSNEWLRLTDKRPAPTGTSFIRIRLIATRAAGPNNDAYFDQVTLRALDNAATHLRGLVRDDGLLPAAR